MDFTREISALLDGAEKLFVEDQINKGIRASGKSAASIKKHPKSNSGKLTGLHYFHQQMHGRAPGKFPPIEAIMRWIEIKGIQPRDPKTSIKSLAFLFARAIARKGTQIFQKKRPPLDPGEGINKLMLEFSRSVLDKMKKTTVRDQMAALILSSLLLFSCGSVQTINGVRVPNKQKQTSRGEVAVLVISFGFGYYVGKNHKTFINKWHNRP